MPETVAKADEESELSPERREELNREMEKIIRLKPILDQQLEPVLAVALNLTGVLLMLGTVHRGIVLAEQSLKKTQEEGKTPEPIMNAMMAAAGMARAQAHAFDVGARAFLEANPNLVKENPAAQRMLDEVLGPIKTEKEEKTDDA